MKKITLFLLAALGGHRLIAQMDKTTIALNTFASAENDSMLGAFVNLNVDITDHVMISSITFVERFPKRTEGTVTRSYIGLGWRNKNATLAGGPYVGAVNHRCIDITKTNITYGAWIFAQTKNGDLTGWAVLSPEGNFIELWKCIKTFNEEKSSKCELQGGITNFKSNFALTFRVNIPKHNLYGFMGYSMKVYEQGDDHGGDTQVQLAKTMQPGIILEVGYSVQYKKKTPTPCDVCN